MSAIFIPLKILELYNTIEMWQNSVIRNISEILRDLLAKEGFIGYDKMDTGVGLNYSGGDGEHVWGIFLSDAKSSRRGQRDGTGCRPV